MRPGSRLVCRRSSDRTRTWSRSCGRASKTNARCWAPPASAWTSACPPPRCGGPGRGAEFSVRLPLLDRSPEAVAPRPIASPDRGAPHHRVLVVEDSWDFAESLRSILEVAGHEIEVVADGEGALAKAMSFRPDIVLCDIGLPGKLDGNAVAAAIRSDPTYGAPYLIALSGYGQPSDKARAQAAGFDRHVTKTEHPRVLLGMIADVPPRAS